MNPSMLTSTGEVNAVLPSNWTAAPDLKSFVASGAVNTAPSAPAPPADPASPSGVDSAAAAGSSSGAGTSFLLPCMI